MEKLGLTRVQARIFLSVLKSGSTSFNEISSISGIARSEVYREMTKLENLGLVERSLGRPITITAIDIDQSLANLLKDKKRENECLLRNFEKTVNFLLNNIPRKISLNVINQVPEFILLPSKNAIVSKISVMIKDAKRFVYLRFQPRKLESILYFAQENIEFCLKKGILFNVISITNGLNYDLKSTNSISDYEKNFQVRKSNEYRPGLLIVDGEQFLIETTSADIFSDSPMLWSHNKLGANFLFQDFKSQWSSCLNYEPHVIKNEEKRALPKLRVGVN